MSGPVQHQVSAAAGLVTRFVGIEMVITGPRRHDVPRLPSRVIREVIANAVAHRTYELDATPIVIEVRPGSVTVTSPGALPEPVTVATLRQARAPRNHTVIDVLRRFGLAEDSGQGIDVVEDNMRMELLAEPGFDAAPDSFAVHLPLTGLVSTTERGWERGSRPLHRVRRSVARFLDARQNLRSRRRVGHQVSRHLGQMLTTGARVSA